MIVEEAWTRIGSLVGKPMNRWTSSRPGTVKFWLERHGEGANEWYQVVTETEREPRHFDRRTFDAFWGLWSEGKRNPDDYRDAGPTGGMFKLAFYLIPAATDIERQVSAGAMSESKRKYKYGDKPTWQHAVDAIRALGGIATVDQIASHITSKFPDFKDTNVHPDLDLVSVNAFGRANWSHNQQPRRVDGTDVYDVLFMEERQGKTFYTFYDPRKHGIWELAPVEGDSKVRPRRIGEQISEALGEIRSELEDEGEFDPSDYSDAREKTLAAIVRRQGQSKFRQALLRAYGRRCALTECAVEDALEAAHIRGYLGEHTNFVTNGLLLRADIHTLFDLGLIRIDPESMAVVVASRLAEGHYADLSGRKLRLPADPAAWPSREALRLHGEQSIAF